LCSAFQENNSPLKLANINEEKGISISADIDNNTYTIGSSKIYASAKQHDLFVLKNNELIATLNISDELKKDTHTVISTLHKAGYSTTLLSGDKKEKCDILSAELGIKTTYSEQFPQDKIAKIETLVNTNKTAMVGDGINDAPALANATIGISLGNATQIAIQSADVVLLNNEDLSQLTQTMQIGKHTLLTIKQNLFWAFAYKRVAIPIAVMGLLNPMWGALFMAFSDVIVIGNSIRLRYKKIF
jgi:Cu+-exporting ATPase